MPEIVALVYGRAVGVQQPALAAVGFAGQLRPQQHGGKGGKQTAHQAGLGAEEAGEQGGYGQALLRLAAVFVRPGGFRLEQADDAGGAAVFFQPRQAFRVAHFLEEGVRPAGIVGQVCPQERVADLVVVQEIEAGCGHIAPLLRRHVVEHPAGFRPAAQQLFTTALLEPLPPIRQQLCRGLPDRWDEGLGVLRLGAVFGQPGRYPAVFLDLFQLGRGEDVVADVGAVPAEIIRPLRPQHAVVDFMGAQEVGELVGGVFGFAQGQLLEPFADMRPGDFEFGRAATGEVSFDIAEQGGAGVAAVGIEAT